MKKAISYSLFGYNKERHKDCFDFSSYLRCLMVNVRMNRLIYPEWEIVLQTNQETYNAFKKLFDNIGIIIRINPPAPLCLAMLWRLKTCFETEKDNWKYSHVICRDLDSPTTYREAQAVKYWINRDKAMHAITDSISHNIPLMGGMIGIRPAYFNEKVGNTWDAMMKLSKGMTFEKKGSDQVFLNQCIYPTFATKGSESITQHYVKGHGDTFLNDYHNTIPDLEIDVPYQYSESNQTCGHIGASGYYETAMFKFLRKYKDQFTDLIEVEKQYPNIFYWCNDNTFE